ncbi:MAG: WecB/TagA/CpsF family glycosyltransferase [Candidatus Melainabacteria bacterium]
MTPLPYCSEKAVRSATTTMKLSRYQPPRVLIEDVPVDAYASEAEFFDHLVALIRKPEQAVLANLNVYAANIAHQNRRFRAFLQSAEMVFCDGVGIVWASKLLPGPKIPDYVTAAEYLPALLDRLSAEGMSVYLLGWQPGVIETACRNIGFPLDGDYSAENPIVGWHHGYIHDDPELQQAVIQDINARQPDLLIVGFGMPMQEFWIDQHRHKLTVRALMPLGAVLDYLSGRVKRCPLWVKKLGLAWLFRLCLEPRRMFDRYVIGNPWFMGRILMRSLRMRLSPQRTQNIHIF